MSIVDLLFYELPNALEIIRSGRNWILINPKSCENPYVNIANQNLAIKQKLVSAAERVIEHGQLINGPEVSILETKLAKYLAVDNVVSVANGTAALYLSLRGLGIGIGDEVITVANSYLATVSSIVLTGATPVLVDV